MITDIAGVRVGHWTDHDARTGCTAVLFPEGTVASGEVRGGAPATREFALLEPHRLVNRLDAVVLSGGSAFGLGAADGAMRWLDQAGVGFNTGVGVVPIVVGMALFDLMVGDPRVRPGPDEGYAACAAAVGGTVPIGVVGAGAGGTTSKWRGRDHEGPGGLVTATMGLGSLAVSCLVAVNAFGDVDSGDRQRLDEQLGAWATGGSGDAAADGFNPDGTGAGGNTTIGLVATNARLTKGDCLVVSQGAHDGLARALFPPHTRLDGDAFVAAATGEVDADVDVVRALAVRVVEEAIRSLA